MSRVTWRGVTLDDRTAKMMAEVAQLMGPVYVRPSQGSYNRGGVAASAGTHDGGGAVDVIVRGWSSRTRARLVAAMRRVGFAAWLRTPAQSNWPYHVHAIAVQPGGKHDQGVLSRGAHAQVIDYYNGRNGLARHDPDDGPRNYVGRTWETYLSDHRDTDHRPPSRDHHDTGEEDDTMRLVKDVGTGHIYLVGPTGKKHLNGEELGAMQALGYTVEEANKRQIDVAAAAMRDVGS